MQSKQDIWKIQNLPYSFYKKNFVIILTLQLFFDIMINGDKNQFIFTFSLI